MSISIEQFKNGEDVKRTVKVSSVTKFLLSLDETQAFTIDELRTAYNDSEYFNESVTDKKFNRRVQAMRRKKKIERRLVDDVIYYKLTVSFADKHEQIKEQNKDVDKSAKKSKKTKK